MRYTCYNVVILIKKWCAMPVTFDEINKQHIPEVLSIYTYYVLNTTATFHTHALSEEEMRSLVFFDDPKYRAYVIKYDGAVCGYVIMSPYGKREAYNDTAKLAIYLKPDHAAMGIGSAAVEYIEKHAIKQNIHTLIAEICGENTASLRLFQKQGYTKCAHLREVGKKFNRLLDVISYQKILK